MGILQNYQQSGVPQNNRIKYGANRPLVTRDIPLDFDDRRTPSKIEQQLVTQGLTRVDDLSRITQIISPLKSKFLANQTALNLTTLDSKKLRNQIVDRQNAKLKKKGKEKRNIFKKIGAGIELLGNALLDTTKIVGSTLAQVPISGTGLHFVRGFGGKSKSTYIRQLDNNLSAAPHVTVKQGNRVEIPLRNIPGNQIGEDFNFQGYIGSELGRTYKSGSAPKILEYDKEFTSTDNYDTGNYLDDGYVNTISGSTRFQNSGSAIDLATSRLANANTVDFEYRGKKGSKLSPDETFVPPAQTTGSVEDVDINKKEIRVNLGNVTAKRSEKSKLKGFFGEVSLPSEDTRENGADSSIPVTADGINMLAPKLVGDNTLAYNGIAEGRDLVKFRFEVVTPSVQDIYPNSHHLYFRAFLDDFSDNYSADWNQYNYLGRAEKFATYGGFNRDLSVNFKVAAMTAKEMRPIYQKLNFLAGATAPTYDGIFMRGTLTRLTIGDYVYRLPGYLTQVGFSWNVDYPFEIAMNRPEDLDRDKIHQELPMIMDVNCSFTPIHEFIPSAGATKEGDIFRTSKFITNGTTTENTYLKNRGEKDSLNGV